MPTKDAACHFHVAICEADYSRLNVYFEARLSIATRGLSLNFPTPLRHQNASMADSTKMNGHVLSRKCDIKKIRKNTIQDAGYMLKRSGNLTRFYNRVADIW